MADRIPLTGDGERDLGAVAIVGLGYVGLPLAVTFADAGVPVVGIDVDRSKIEAIADGRSYIADVAEDDLARLVREGRLRATTDFAAAVDVGAVLVCLPTPLDENREPDLSIVRAGIADLAPHLRPGHLLVLESTTYPGTTREVVGPIVAAEGLEPGRDVHLAFSPERVDPGRTDWTTKTTPKVVGGLTEACTAAAVALYERAVDRVVAVSTPEAAEMTKLLENIFRSVNIALVNELAMLCDRMGVDVWEVIDAAATKPFGFMRFLPGPGLGGHCIPVDPFYLAWRARRYDFWTEFIELAGKVNENMPRHCLHVIARALNQEGRALNGARVLVCGVAYKPNVGDARESPAIKLMGLLLREGARVRYHDPHVGYVPEHDLESTPLDPGECDVAVIVTDHDDLDLDALLDEAPVVVDLRNATRGRPSRARIERL